MGKSAADTPAQTAATRRSLLGRDLGLLLVLVLLSGGLRLWVIRHTVVAARDSVGFINYAWQLQHRPWARVFSESHQHPGYPVAILALSVPLSRMLGGNPCDTMVLSAQVVSAAAGCLLIFPMFYLGRRLFNRRVGFWAAALFQCLPLATRVTCDGLSEAIFLLAAATTLLLAVSALQANSALRFALCGLCGGLVYLIRPEGALTVAATGLVLLGSQAFAGQRRPWRRTLACMAGLVSAALAVAGPYIYLTGRLTTKPTGQRILQAARQEGTPADDLPAAASQAMATPRPSCRPAATRPLMALVLGVRTATGEEGVSDGRLLWGVWAVGAEIQRGSQYVLGLAALVGLYWFRNRLRAVPGAWVLLLVCLLQTLALCRVAQLMGYVSERHVLIIVLCETFWAVAAIQELPRHLAGWRQTTAVSEISAPAGRQSAWLTARVWSAVLLIGVAGAGFPKLLQPLHGTHGGHRAAGLWLAAHTNPADVIRDPFLWAMFYAGRVLQEGPPADRPLGAPPVQYVVLERSRDPHPEMIEIPALTKLAAQGKLVYDWQPKPGVKNQGVEVQVYAVPPAGTVPP